MTCSVLGLPAEPGSQEAMWNKGCSHTPGGRSPLTAHQVLAVLGGLHPMAKGQLISCGALNTLQSSLVFKGRRLSTIYPTCELSVGHQQHMYFFFLVFFPVLAMAVSYRGCGADSHGCLWTQGSRRVALALWKYKLSSSGHCLPTLM